MQLEEAPPDLIRTPRTHSIKKAGKRTALVLDSHWVLIYTFDDAAVVSVTGGQVDWRAGMYSGKPRWGRWRGPAPPPIFGWVRGRPAAARHLHGDGRWIGD